MYKNINLIYMEKKNNQKIINIKNNFYINTTEKTNVVDYDCLSNSCSSSTLSSSLEDENIVDKNNICDGCFRMKCLEMKLIDEIDDPIDNDEYEKYYYKILEYGISLCKINKVNKN